MPRRHWKLVSQLGVEPDQLAVVSCIAQQQDDPGTAEVPLLRSDASDQGLNVVHAGLRLEHRLERRFTLEGIHAPPIADDGHRYLETQATTRAETNAQPFEQSELRGVANRRAVRVEADSGVEAKDGGDNADQLDGKARHFAAFQPADGLMRPTYVSAQLALTQPGREARLADLFADPSTKVASEPAPSLNG